MSSQSIRPMQEQKVQLLDQNTANQIAAGEVVEKPASVVKELVENALDAGARKIEVTVYGGGTEYIRVADDGCGMSEENARLAVLRHATSKIAKAQDLLTLQTLGFRGEALPSIASVSKFTLLTRPADAEFATSVKIEGGADMEVSSMGGNAGTAVVVEELFFNVPARRKFLKTAATEGRYISELLTKLALSRPDVRFKLTNNDREVLSTPGSGDLQDTVRALYGKNVASELLQVDFADEQIKIRGYISKPTLLKSTRQWQTLFVNGRTIQSPMLSKAIDHAYQSQVPKSGFPFTVLNIIVDTASIDVNVHPQKSEIKFSDDNRIYTAMYKALTDALTRPMSAAKAQITSLLPDSELNVYKPVAKPQSAAVTQQAGAAKAQAAAASAAKALPPRSPFDGLGQIFKTPASDVVKEADNADYAAKADKAQAVPAAERQNDDGREKPALRYAEAEDVLAQAEAASQQLIFPGNKCEYKAVQTPVLAVHEARAEFFASRPNADGAEIGCADGVKDTAAAPRETIAYTNTDDEQLTIWPIGQVDKTFIIAQSEDSLYLIDQHAAHERILYDKLCASHAQVPAQQLLMPLYLTLPDDDITLLEEQQQEFLHLGVEAAAAGENVLRVSSLPADIKAEDAEDFIRSIAAMLREQRGGHLDGSTLRQELLHMTACKAAIKAGQLLNMQQMRQLIISLCNTAHPFTCPHGRPCMIEIDSDKLYKMFKRTGF